MFPAPVIVHGQSNQSSKNMMVEECTEGPHQPTLEQKFGQG
jgi:hypothetical protein